MTMTGCHLYKLVLDTTRDAARRFRYHRDLSLLDALQQARAYVVSDSAEERIERAMRAYPEQVVRNQQFAIQPFPCTWVETESGFGFLVEEDGEVHMFRDRHGQMEPGAITYQINIPHAVRLSRAKLLALGAHYMGSVLARDASPALLADLARGHLIHVVDQTNWDEMAREFPDLLREGPEAREALLGASMEAQDGALLRVLAILLAMNQPSHMIHFSETPRRRGLVGNKPTVFAGYTTVDILLDKPRLLLRKPPSTGHHRSPRWHEVRGHFVHRGGEPGCAHDWEPLAPVDDADTRRRWVCTACERKRTWRECPEGRGSARVGYVRQDRRVRVWGEDGDNRQGGQRP